MSGAHSEDDRLCKVTQSPFSSVVYAADRIVRCDVNESFGTSVVVVEEDTLAAVLNGQLVRVARAHLPQDYVLRHQGQQERMRRPQQPQQPPYPPVARRDFEPMDLEPRAQASLASVPFPSAGVPRVPETGVPRVPETLVPGEHVDVMDAERVGSVKPSRKRARGKETVKDN